VLLIKRKIKRKIKRRKVSCDRKTLIQIYVQISFHITVRKKGRSFLKVTKQDSSTIIRNVMREELLYAKVKIFYP
jgi:hypothetical protein